MKIDLISLIEKNDFIDLNSKYLEYLISRASKKFKNQTDFCTFLDNTKPSNWYGRYGRKKGLKLIQLNKLAYLCDINKKETYKRILGFKKTGNGNYLRLKSLVIDEHLCRVLGFIIGDGCIEKGRIRFSNSEESVINYMINYFIKNGLGDYIKTQLVYPRNYSKTLIKKCKSNWERIIKRKIDYVYPKHKTFINNREFKESVSYLEIGIYSKTYAIIINKILPLVRMCVFKKPSLGMAYLQGIYAAEGSVSYNNKNNLRQILINMKDKEEIDFVSRILNYLKIENSGVKKSNNMFYASITNKINLKKCDDINLFKINEKRKNKLKLILKNYQREQTISRKRSYRYNQIEKIIKENGKISSFKLSKLIDTSLVRTQVLLMDGFTKNRWLRSWDGNKFIYSPKLEVKCQ